MNKRDLEKALEREVESWPGVSVEFVNATKGGHPKAKYKFGDMVLSRPYASTPSDSAHGIHRMLGEHRRILKQLGAERNKPEPTAEEDEAPYRKPNGGAAERPSPVEGQRAAAKPDMADQLVALKVAAEPATATVEDGGVIGKVEWSEAEGARIVGDPVGVSDEPAERLLKQLTDRGFDLQTVGPISRAGIVRAAAEMIVDGVYFGLPEEVYHNVPRLGASSLSDLNKSPGDFWAGSWLDPDRKEEDEDDKAWKVVGRAYHCARLEPDQFEVRYCRKPCKADFAEEARKTGACWNGTDIGNQLASMGATKKAAGESVAQQGERLESEGYGGVIWPLIEARAEAEAQGRTQLDAKVWDEIVRDMERLQQSKAIAAKFTLEGASEVSVFWTDENKIQRKARFDRMEPDHWLDFKTFDNSRGKRLDQAIADAVRFNRYYLTAASYLDAAEALRTGGLQVIGEATDVERALVARIQIKPELQDCWFVFQQKSGVPNLLARRFRFYDVPDAITNSWDTGADEEAQARGHDATRRPTQIYSKGRAEIMYAKKLFVLYSQVYPPGEPWAPLEPEGSISDLDFNPNWLEGRYE